MVVAEDAESAWSAVCDSVLGVGLRWHAGSDGSRCSRSGVCIRKSAVVVLEGDGITTKSC